MVDLRAEINVTSTIDDASMSKEVNNTTASNYPHWGDRLMIRTGDFLAWLFPILVIAIISQVMLRKAGLNQAWLDDAQWWMYGLVVLVGFGYAVTTNSHVRVDIFYANYSEKKKSKIDVFGLGWLFLPFLVLMADITMHYAAASWASSEGSDSPNGLHGLYLLKSAIPIIFVITLIATYARLHFNVSKFFSPHTHNLVIAAFPAAWFIAERFTYYCLWWYVHINNPDIHIRRVSKDPMLDNTMWIGLCIVIHITAISFLNNHKQPSEK